MTMTSQLPVLDRSVSLSEIADFSQRLSQLTGELRKKILAPRPRKNPPTFTTSQIAELCGLDRSKVNYLATREGGELPSGQVHGTGRSREFTLAEARAWVHQVSDIYQTGLVTGAREGDGKILLVSNFKGGSAKTTTSMCLAQGLSLRGRKVLVIDLDPQASLSELCGLYAEKEVEEHQTVLPYIYDQNMEGGLLSVAQSTYWDGLDVIPAHTSLFAAEFHLPGMVKQNPNFKFWSILRQGLEPLRKHYDYIVIDTAPSLSYLTLNALMAADAMVMPLVPESLDFVSSVSFWGLFSDLAQNFMAMEEEKQYDFISVLLSKVDYGVSSSAPIVRGWVQRAYGDWLHSIEVPASSVLSNGALAFSTVFDISKSSVSAKAFQRVREPLADFCRWIDDQYVEQWRTAQ
ncbi:ParA family protein [Ralstonia soli]|uniref:AAA family ATPase n=1 Tax=Ralstonia soli TaxID=2953896 RepID=A0ABT1AE41_9RALS|nr:AAA family ATPase [Ralstonia soli]MCO5396655.1 AAA family ATPase [Ralstonia soli]